MSYILSEWKGSFLHIWILHVVLVGDEIYFLAIVDLGVKIFPFNFIINVLFLILYIY